MKIFFSIFALLMVYLPAHADFEALSITQSRNKEGQSLLCYKPTLEAKKPNCVVVQTITPEKLKDDPELDLVEVHLTEYTVTGSADFAAVIQWKGNAKGTFKIAGPAGRIFAIGYLKDGEIKIDRFSDEKLSQQFDRAMLFGESDPMRLRIKTQIWLESILLPSIQAHFNDLNKIAPKP